VSEEGIERRLTTILAADVVGYSRLMAQIGINPTTGLKRKVWVIGLAGILLLGGCTPSRYQELITEGDEHYSQGRSDDAILSYEAAFQETKETSEILESSSRLSEAYEILGRTTINSVNATLRGVNIVAYCIRIGTDKYCDIPEELKQWPQLNAIKSDYEICNFAVTIKGGTASWDNQAAWLDSVREAKRRNLTPNKCAELLGR